MKFKVFVVIITLVLSLGAWAQENPAAPNATPKPETKSCCHHAMGAKSCGHANADAKDAASCCGKGDMKDGKSCCSGMEMKDSKSCSGGKDMKACMKQCKKNGGCKDGKCCGEAGATSASNCCGNKCERHAQATAGN